MILGLDTATPATVVAVLPADGEPVELRHDPAPGERPGHAAQLLPLARRALDALGVSFADVRRIGVGVPVTSPTFTIARRYEDGRVPISHLDLYRLDGLDGEEPELLDDELTGERVAFVEWPEQVGCELGEVRVAARVRLEHLGGDRRRVIIEP